MSGQNWPDGQPEYAINSARFGWIFESKCADLGGDEEGDGDGEKEAALSENIVDYGQSMPKACPKDPQLWPEYGQNMARRWPEDGQNMAKLP